MFSDSNLVTDRNRNFDRNRNLIEWKAGSCDGVVQIGTGTLIGLELD